MYEATVEAKQPHYLEDKESQCNQCGRSSDMNIAKASSEPTV